MPDGYITARIYVGNKITCPPARRCPGQSDGVRYCTIFGKKVKPARDRRGKMFKHESIGGYMYLRCDECIKAENRNTADKSGYIRIAGHGGTLDISLDDLLG